MKIVIDIPEEDYKFIKDLQFYHSGRRSGKTIERNVINAIKKGTPLPKGHGRLIDVSEYFNKAFGDAREFLDKAQTIIEADKETEND